MIDEIFLCESLSGCVEFVHREQIQDFDLLLTSRLKLLLPSLPYLILLQTGSWHKVTRRNQKKPFGCEGKKKFFVVVNCHLKEQIIDTYEQMDYTYIDNNEDRVVYQGFLRALRSAPAIRESAEGEWI